MPLRVFLNFYDMKTDRGTVLPPNDPKRLSTRTLGTLNVSQIAIDVILRHHIDAPTTPRHTDQIATFLHGDPCRDLA